MGRSNTIILRSWINSLWRPAIPPLLLFAAHLVAFVSGAYDYATGFPIDIPLHFFGGMAIGFFFHRALMSAAQLGMIGPYRPFTHRLLVFMATCTAAVLWEVAEFLVDFRLGTRDTITDLLLGSAGTLLVIILTTRRP